jgi:predicted DNA-binding transcriptional regulator YafY
MDQLSRLISVLTLLKSKRVLTASELAKKYDISVRTVYRDIRKLEEAGVPIVTLEGVGYTLMEGYSVAPVQFTERQANSLITAHHMVKKTQDASFIQDFEESLTKIKSVFKSSILEKSELLDKQIYVLDQRYEKIDSNALAEIQMSITNFNVLEINYQKANDPEVSFRKIEPCAFYSIDNKWILVAWCHLRLSYRAFRIDRIHHFKVLSEKFADRKFNLQAYFTNGNY